MQNQNPAHEPGPEGQLAEVWGDVVSRPQLGRAVIIGAVISVAVYWIALKTIAPMAETPAVGKALAMLAGVLGCLAGGAISAKFFRPKRVVLEEMPVGATWQDEIIDQIIAEGGQLGRVEDLPAPVAQEMKEVGLYDLFRDYERKQGAQG